MEPKLKNTFTLSGEILTRERRTSRKGNSYTTGQCQVDGMEAALPYLAFGSCQAHLMFSERLVFTGTIRTENKLLYLFIDKVQLPISDQVENHCELYLCADQDGGLRYSIRGTAWTVLAAVLKSGKDEDESVRPFWTIDVKGFEQNGDESIPLSIAVLDKGDCFRAAGSLVHGRDHESHSWSLIVEETIQLHERVNSAFRAELVPE